MANYLTVTLPAPIKVKALGNREVEISVIEIHQMIDNPVKKTVTVMCRNHPTRIVLWKDAEYDTIGQWTDTDVVNRVLELYTKP